LRTSQADPNLPLLFQGGDFSRTDIVNAMAALGFTLGAKGEARP
jgi:hypothetical protein